MSQPESNEAHNIIVKRVKEYDARNGTSHEVWSVWRGQEKQADTGNREGAVIYARQVSALNGGLPVWLEDGAYGPHPVDLSPIKSEPATVTA